MGIRKLCSRFVSYFLNHEMCQRRLQCCENNSHILKQSATVCRILSLLTMKRRFHSCTCRLTIVDHHTSTNSPKEKAKWQPPASHRQPLMLTIFSNSHRLCSSANQNQRSILFQPRGQHSSTFFTITRPSTLLNSPMRQSTQLQWLRSLISRQVITGCSDTSTSISVLVAL